MMMREAFLCRVSFISLTSLGNFPLDPKDDADMMRGFICR